MRLQLTLGVLAGALLCAGTARGQESTEVSTRVDVYADEWITVVSPGLRAKAPVGDKLTLEARYAFDALSGATYAMSTDAVSSATSVAEQRHQVDFSVSLAQSAVQTISAFYLSSLEPDSATHVVGVAATREILDRMTEIRAGYRIELGSVGTVFTADRQDYRAHVLDLGWNQIINAETSLELMATGEVVDCDAALGCNASPYRFVPIFGSQEESQPMLAVGERHPATRYRAATSARLSRYLAPGLGAHAFYRFYADSWRITGHTVELTGVKSLMAERLVLRLDLRGTRQSAAQFFSGRYEESGELPMIPNHRSADREMAGLIHGTAGGRLEWHQESVWGLDDIALTARVARLWYRYDDVGSFPRRTAWLIGGGFNAVF